MTRITKPLPGTVPDPLYPDSDGEPVGESDFHMIALILLREALEDFFAAVADVYVASDLFWYWEEGNPRAARAPDVMVVRGVGKHNRLSFRSWEEKARPGVLFEIASERTWQEDTDDKVLLYARLGVREYFVFDPEGKYLRSTLRGYRLKGRRYARLAPDTDGALASQELGLRLVPEGSMVRLRDLRTGRRVLTRAERAKNAERRARRLQAELTRLRQLMGTGGAMEAEEDNGPDKE
jgi:Uma2 family endonuclease